MENLKVELNMYNLDCLHESIAILSKAIVKNFDTALDRPLTLKQTCGWPISAGERGLYRVVAVPHYEAEGCEGGPFYSSVLITRADRRDFKSVNDLKCRVMAINSMNSCSGYLLPGKTLAELRVLDTIVELGTGSHLESLKAVVEGKADFAALDCVSFALFREHKKALCDQIKIIGRTPKFHALPYVTTANYLTEEELIGLRNALQRTVVDSRPEIAGARSKLLIKEFSFDVGESDYEMISDAFLGDITKIGNKRFPVEDTEIVNFLQQRLTMDKFRVEEIKKILRDRSSVRESWQEFNLKDGRYCRIIFPGGDPFDFGKEERFNITLFTGERPRLPDRCEDDNVIASKIWETDHAMSRSLDANIVRVYLTLQTDLLGNFLNFVVYRDVKNAEDFREAADRNGIHSGAVSGLSPKYYSFVYIHRGSIIDSGGEEGGTIDVTQTIFLQFSKGAVLRRKTFKWKE